MSVAPLPPQNLDAEERVLGAIMVAGALGPDASSKTLAKVRATGIEPPDFYRASHRVIYEAMLAVDERGEPAEVLAVERELEAREKVADAGKDRLVELVTIAPATANAAHYARLVVDASERREQFTLAIELRDSALNGDVDVELRERLTRLLGPRRTEALDRLRGLTTDEVLGLKVPPTQELIEAIAEAGTVGTIAALPGTFKSFLVAEIAHKVASGGGSVLGRQVVRQGSVGYWWQDDSIENEVRRVQAYAGRHGYIDALDDPDDPERVLPIRWHLNEGLRLPDDLSRLREEVEREEQVLVVLDSLYNFLPGRTLKDEDVAVVYTSIKEQVCDPTGAAVVVVDHAPWPTEGNKGQRRAYGSVFKAAAIRWGIYLVTEGDSLYVEARGNNIAGLPRTPVMFDAERLELRILKAPSQEVDLDARIADFLRRNVGASSTVVRAGVKGDDGAIGRRLNDSDAFVTVPPVLFGMPRNAKCWARAEDAPSLLNTTPVEEATGVAPGLAREINDNLGEATTTYEVGVGRTDPGLSSPVEDAPTFNDDAAEEAAERRST